MYHLCSVTILSQPLGNTSCFTPTIILQVSATSFLSNWLVCILSRVLVYHLCWWLYFWLQLLKPTLADPSPLHFSSSTDKPLPLPPATTHSPSNLPSFSPYNQCIIHWYQAACPSHCYQTYPEYTREEHSTNKPSAPSLTCLSYLPSVKEHHSPSCSTYHHLSPIACMYIKQSTFLTLVAFTGTFSTVSQILKPTILLDLLWLISLFLRSKKYPFLCKAQLLLGKP